MHRKKVQSATQSLLNNGKMKLLEMTVKQNGHQLGLQNHKFPGISNNIPTYFPILFSSLGFFFSAGQHNTKCLASLDFLFFGICCYSAWTATWQHFLLVSNNPRTVSIIKRQHIKLRALLFLASLLLYSRRVGHFSGLLWRGFSWEICWFSLARIEFCEKQIEFRGREWRGSK